MSAHASIETVTFSEALASKHVSIDYPPTPLHELLARWPWLKLPWQGEIPNCKHEHPPQPLTVLDVVTHMYDDHFADDRDFYNWLAELESARTELMSRR
jgi:hypothetical protein